MGKILKTKCIKCGSGKAVKNGFVSGWQRYKCKNCGYQYTKQSPHGHPIVTRLLSSNLYAFGLKKNAIAALVGVTPTTIARWIKKYHIFYMTEVLPSENRQVLHATDLDSYFNNTHNSEILAIKKELPSGARLDILLHLPPKV